MRLRWTACLALLCASPTPAQTGWLPVEQAPDGRTNWRAGSDELLVGYGSDGLVRSRDGGATAEHIFEGIETEGYRVNGLYVSGGVLAVWAVDEATYENGLAFFSRDGGDTWTSGVVPDAFVGDFAAVGDTLVFGVDSGVTDDGREAVRVLWSIDDGASWVSEPLDTSSFEVTFSRTLFVSRGALYAATDRGLYRAARGAEDWTRVTDGALGAGGGRINLWDSAVGHGTAYASTSGGCGAFLPGVYRRPAGETEWVRSDVEAELSLQTNACYLDGTLAAVGDTVVTGLRLPGNAPTPGVPLSADGGVTWRFVGEGLAERAGGGVILVRAFPAMGTIYVETYEPDGADPATRYYRLQTAADAGPEPPPEPRGVRVWPNPASSALRVETPTPATVRAYSVTGRLVLPEQRVDGLAELDVTGLAPGVYLLEVRLEPGRWIKRFTVVR